MSASKTTLSLWLEGSQSKGILLKGQKGLRAEQEILWCQRAKLPTSGRLVIFFCYVCLNNTTYDFFKKTLGQKLHFFFVQFDYKIYYFLKNYFKYFLKH